jgi:type I restriction-modification system DNA methylase subunit/restriction endonuclease S subunit
MELSNLTNDDLKNICERLEIKGYKSKNKAQLIDLITKKDNYVNIVQEYITTNNISIKKQVKKKNNEEKKDENIDEEKKEEYDDELFKLSIKELDEIFKFLNIEVKSNSKKRADKINLIKQTENYKTYLKEYFKIDLSYLRLPDNQIIYELKDDDNDSKNFSKSNIIKMIDIAHNILYNAENIEGEDALNDIMNFIFIKSIAPLLSDKVEDGKIDLLNKVYYKDLFEDETLNRIFSYFQNLNILANSELDTIRNLNETNDAIREMGEILKTHPLTKQIYTENNFIKSKKAPTIQSLLNQVICKIDIKELENNEDVIGEIYEHIINGYVKKGSKLGQFFTPRKLMHLISQYKQNRIHEIIQNIDGPIKLYDSCLGTAGWMVVGYNMLKSQYGDRLLVSGGEVKPSTFQYGLMNLILTLKKFPYDVQCESSLTHINNNKHHLSWTNPPFSTDKKFDELIKNFRHDRYTEKNNVKLDHVYKLQDDNPPIQFLELDLYKLEENGMCFIVLPYGKLFFGDSHKKSRQYFMTETNITDIILFESGTFTHTGIKTAVIIFEKDKSGTKSINFLMANKECNKLTKITSVLREDIRKEMYESWYLRDYLKDEYIESLSCKMTKFEWVDFGEIFTLEKGQIQSSKVEEDDGGEYRIISISEKDKFTNNIDKSILIFGENVFIATTSSGTSCGPYETKFKYNDGICTFTNLLSRLILNNKYKDRINIKYIYYFMKSIKEHIEKIYEKGSCNKSLDVKNFNRLKIPIPSLEEQSKIIEKVSILENDRININKGIESNKNMRLNYMESMIKNANRREINKIMRLGELCEISNGTNITTKDFIDGDYPVIGGGISYIGFHNEFNADENTITIAKDGSCGVVIKHKNKIFVSNHGLFISKINENIITKEYLYNYLLLIEHVLKSYGKGSSQQGINKDDILIKINVPVPPIEWQENMKTPLNNFDKMDDGLNYLLDENEKHCKISFMDKLDSYGNPFSFNLDNIIGLTE